MTSLWSRTLPASSTGACGRSVIPGSLRSDARAYGQPAHVRQDDAAGRGGPLDGEYYGHAVAVLGHAEMKHPGTPILYDPSKPVAEGGLTFRARFGVERDGDNLLAEGSWSVDSEIRTVIRSSPWPCCTSLAGMVI